MKYDFYEQVYPDGQILYHLHLDTMTDEEYDKLKPTIEHLGGHWREKYKCFVFGSDIRGKLEDCKKNGLEISEQYLWKEKTQFFPTPRAVAERVVELAEIEDKQFVLEPSAGQGGLVDCIKTDNPILCIEPLEENIQILAQKGYVTGRMTFEEYYAAFDAHRLGTRFYDRVIMNPPFSGQRDIKHLLMAYDLLDKGGILVAIISENALYYQTETSKNFVKFLAEHNAMIEAVPPRAFTESGTTIETVIVKIIKT